MSKPIDLTSYKIETSKSFDGYRIHFKFNSKGYPYIDAEVVSVVMDKSKSMKDNDVQFLLSTAELLEDLADTIRNLKEFPKII